MPYIACTNDFNTYRKNNNNNNKRDEKNRTDNPFRSLCIIKMKINKQHHKPQVINGTPSNMFPRRKAKRTKN